MRKAEVRANGRLAGFLFFPCFSNLLSEGANKSLQCLYHKLDKDDEFGLLLATAQNYLYNDAIGIRYW